MSLAELILEHVRRLPEPLAREVLDFAVFLEARSEREAQRDLSAAQAGPLNRLWDTPEDRVWDEL
ncbi:DUF2281 domain-containing protein [Brevundimonas aveniformis]|uniref:DUF2281 domain-containing protein n=1 Tax=Brevundimonas aveniformis TaxID=370977 RepID=UPI002492BF87|nr:DUF2281 domain-containing protein [Brevundimonas aveniformis]